jgi:hypothetical protein
MADLPITGSCGCGGVRPGRSCWEEIPDDRLPRYDGSPG